jgi:hypothetical protein
MNYKEYKDLYNKEDGNFNFYMASISKQDVSPIDNCESTAKKIILSNSIQQGEITIELQNTHKNSQNKMN